MSVACPKCGSRNTFQEAEWVGVKSVIYKCAECHKQFVETGGNSTISINPFQVEWFPRTNE